MSEPAISLGNGEIHVNPAVKEKIFKSPGEYAAMTKVYKSKIEPLKLNEELKNNLDSALLTAAEAVMAFMSLQTRLEYQGAVFHASAQESGNADSAGNETPEKALEKYELEPIKSFRHREVAMNFLFELGGSPKKGLASKRVFGLN